MRNPSAGSTIRRFGTAFDESERSQKARSPFGPAPKIDFPSELNSSLKKAQSRTGTSHDRGSVTPGKLADLALIDGEPTADIADLRKVALVVTQGHWLSPRELHEEMGIAPFVKATPAVRPAR